MPVGVPSIKPGGFNTRYADIGWESDEMEVHCTEPLGKEYSPKATFVRSRTLETAFRNVSKLRKFLKSWKFLKFLLFGRAQPLVFKNFHFLRQAKAAKNARFHLAKGPEIFKNRRYAWRQKMLGSRCFVLSF